MKKADRDADLNAMKQAILLQPNNPEFHHHLGEIYVQIGDHEKAKKAFMEAIRLRPTEEKFHTHLASSLTLDGIEAPKEALQKFKEGLVYLDQGKHIDAVKMLRGSIALYSENDLAWAALAEAALGLGELNEAQTSIQKALKLYPNEARYRVIESQIENKRGNTAVAIEAMEKALESNNRYADYAYELGALYLQAGFILSEFSQEEISALKMLFDSQLPKIKSLDPKQSFIKEWPLSLMKLKHFLKRCVHKLTAA